MFKFIPIFTITTQFKMPGSRTDCCKRIIIIKQMQGQITPQQFELTLKLCDMLSIDDFEVAAMMLKQCNWSIERALGMEQQPIVPAKKISTTSASAKKPEEMKQQSSEVPAQQEQWEESYNYVDEGYGGTDFEGNNEYEDQYNYYQAEINRQEDLNNKKKIFDSGFVSMPLVKTKSATNFPDQSRLATAKKISQNYSQHRMQYQTQLLKNSFQLCERLLHANPQQIQICSSSIKKNENNRIFIAYLHQQYKSSINFTFGTFFLNLARSYLDSKLLLVYVHRSEHEEKKAVRMLLQHGPTAKFINKNCICYGMFDNHDDYEIIHKYVSMRELPAFLLLRFNKKQLKQQLIGLYSIVQEDPRSFLQWLSVNSGISANLEKDPKAKANTQNEGKIFQMSNIIYEQNLQYEQMARLYQMKRHKSQARKQSIEIFQQKIEQARQKFAQEPEPQPCTTIRVKFRLPITGNTLVRNFYLSSKISQLYEYIDCFGRDEFEEKLAEFDLTQSFPKLSLKQKQEMTIAEVFGESEQENLIVKQL